MYTLKDADGNNYVKALELVDRGIAHKHPTFKDTGYIFIDLGEDWVGYISPKNVFIDITINNIHVAHGNIDLDKLMVFDANHRPDYNRHIVKSEGWCK